MGNPLATLLMFCTRLRVYSNPFNPAVLPRMSLGAKSKPIDIISPSTNQMLLRQNDSIVHRIQVKLHDRLNLTELSLQQRQ